MDKKEINKSVRTFALKMKHCGIGSRARDRLFPVIYLVGEENNCRRWEKATGSTETTMLDSSA